MSLAIKDFKPYVPAKNFELSKQFYAALGFSMSEGWGDTADFELNGHAFRLQNYYVRDWAENFMFVIGVEHIEAWHRRVTELLNSNLYPDMSVQAPQVVEDSLVLHVGDPSGVLLVFVQ